jgi:hypothetical protein
MFAIELMGIAGRLVVQDEMDAGEKIALLFEAVINRVPREFGVRENLRIRLETNGGAVFFVSPITVRG